MSHLQRIYQHSSYVAMFQFPLDKKYIFYLCFSGNDEILTCAYNNSSKSRSTIESVLLGIQPKWHMGLTGGSIWKSAQRIITSKPLRKPTFSAESSTSLNRTTPLEDLVLLVFPDAEFRFDRSQCILFPDGDYIDVLPWACKVCEGKYPFPVCIDSPVTIVH